MSDLPRSHKHEVNLQGALPALLTQSRSRRGVSSFLGSAAGAQIWNNWAPSHATTALNLFPACERVAASFISIGSQKGRHSLQGCVKWACLCLVDDSCVKFFYGIISLSSLRAACPYLKFICSPNVMGFFVSENHKVASLSCNPDDIASPSNRCLWVLGSKLLSVLRLPHSDSHFGVFPPLRWCQCPGIFSPYATIYNYMQNKYELRHKYSLHYHLSRTKSLWNVDLAAKRWRGIQTK